MLGFGTQGYETAQATEEFVDTIPNPDGDLLSIRPSKNGQGLKNATGYVRDMHKVPRGRGPKPVYSFEMWFEDGKIRFVCLAPDEQEVLDTLSGQFPDASAHDQYEPLPTIEPGSYISGGELVMEMDCVFPTRSLKGVDPFETDPYASLLPKLAGRDDEHAAAQVVFEPISEAWYNRGWLGHLRGETGDGIAEAMKEGHSEGEINPRVVQSEKDRDAARDISNQRNKASYRVCVRTLAVGDNPTVAEERAAAIGNIFDDYFNHVTGQGFTEHPAAKSELMEHAESMALRDMPQQSGLKRRLFGADRVLTVDQLGIIAHFPNEEEVPSHNLDWSRMDSGPGVPADAPQPDFAEGGR